MITRVLLALCLAPMLLGAQIGKEEYAARRAALMNAITGDAIVVAIGAGEPEADYLRFFQDPGMRYLTGILEPDANLVIVRHRGATNEYLFVQPKDPAQEVWTGKRMGPTVATTMTGIAAVTSPFPKFVDSLGRLGIPFRVIGTEDNARRAFGDAFLADYPNAKVEFENPVLARLRGRKSRAELALIRKSVEITVAAQQAAMRAARPGMFEYELEAIIESGFRKAGAERPSFATIIGSGPNGTTLHYNVNDRQIQPGDVVVMDVGSSYMGYAADVTRTIPVNGTFSADQRAIYQIVRDAQAAAERNAKPGMRAQAMSDSASAIIAAGLARLGLIESATATYDVVAGDQVTRRPQVELYYMHGLGHGIGLEVHDPEQFYFSGVIAEGSAFSIEPGIYVRENLLQILADTPRNRALIAKIRPAVERYRNIGVRIEDDYIVTDKGLEWISRAPREIAEIEALMRRPVP